jgi:multidrug efflux pump subunit AcrA (membrane-fusion protein)
MNPPARSRCALSSQPAARAAAGDVRSRRIDEGIMNDAILAPQQGITRDAKGDATALVVDANNKVEQRSVKPATPTATNGWC